MVLSLLVLLAPALALQVVVEFALQIDWSGVDASFRRYTEDTPLSASGVVYAALGLTVGVLLYNRIDQHVFSRILVGGMLLGGVSYVAHSAAALLSEEAPAGVLRWLMQLYVGTVQEADAPQ